MPFEEESSLVLGNFLHETRSSAWMQMNCMNPLWER